MKLTIKANQVKGWCLWREETVVPGGNSTQTQLIYDAESGNRSGPHRWEASALATALYLPPSSFAKAESI